MREAKLAIYFSLLKTHIALLSYKKNMKTGRFGSSGLHVFYKKLVMASNGILFDQLFMGFNKTVHHIGICQGGDIPELIEFVRGDLP